MAPVVDLKRTADNTEGPLKFNMQIGRVSRPLRFNMQTGRVSRCLCYYRVEVITTIWHLLLI